MRMFVKRFGALLMAALFSTGISLSVPGTAYAAACWDRGCNGGNPQTSGCAATGITVLTAPVKNPQGTTWGYVDLRYSNACGANWSRTRSGQTAYCAVGSTIYNNKGDTPGPTVYQDGWTSYSTMLSGYSALDRANGFITCDYGSAVGWANQY